METADCDENHGDNTTDSNSEQQDSSYAAAPIDQKHCKKTERHSVQLTQMHCDIIGNKFWQEYPYILQAK